jgi:diguanylate cyclase (GGDEF)-like protein
MNKLDREDTKLKKIWEKTNKIALITHKIYSYIQKHWYKTQATDKLEKVLDVHLPDKIKQTTTPLIWEIRWEVKKYIEQLLENSIELQDSAEELIWDIDDVNKEKEAVVQKYNKILEEQDKLIDENKELWKIANTDALTWLRNARWLNQDINELVKKYHHKKILRWVSIAVLDIDDFKSINDTYWHWNWDTILINLSLLLTSYFWDEDFTVYRKWWEEFVIVSEIDNETFKTRVERFLERLRWNEIRRDKTNSIRVTFSWATTYTKKLELWERQPANWSFFNKEEIYEIIVDTLWRGLIEAKAIKWKWQIVHK